MDPNQYYPPSAPTPAPPPSAPPPEAQAEPSSPDLAPNRLCLTDFDNTLIWEHSFENFCFTRFPDQKKAIEQGRQQAHLLKTSIPFELVSPGTVVLTDHNNAAFIAGVIAGKDKEVVPLDSVGVLESLDIAHTQLTCSMFLIGNRPLVIIAIKPSTDRTYKDHRRFLQSHAVTGPKSVITHPNKGTKDHHVQFAQECLQALFNVDPTDVDFFDDDLANIEAVRRAFPKINCHQVAPSTSEFKHDPVGVAAPSAFASHSLPQDGRDDSGSTALPDSSQGHAMQKSEQNIKDTTLSTASVDDDDEDPTPETPAEAPPPSAPPPDDAPVPPYNQTPPQWSSTQPLATAPLAPQHPRIFEASNSHRAEILLTQPDNPTPEDLKFLKELDTHTLRAALSEVLAQRLYSLNLESMNVVSTRDIKYVLEGPTTKSPSTATIMRTILDTRQPQKECAVM